MFPGGKRNEGWSCVAPWLPTWKHFGGLAWWRRQRNWDGWMCTAEYGRGKRYQKKSSWHQLRSCLCLSHSVMSWLFVVPQTVASQNPLSMGIRQARILEWVAVSFSRGSSRPRDQTRMSCITGRFFIIWATRKPSLCLNMCFVCVCVCALVSWVFGGFIFGCTHSIQDLSSMTTYVTCICCNGNTEC